MSGDSFENAADAPVFVRDYTIHKNGHPTCTFWSTEDRQSHARCGCGWASDGTDPQGMVDMWREHVGAS